MWAIGLAIAVLALVGHAAIWVGLNNRCHATGLPRYVVKCAVAVCHLALLAIPPIVLIALVDPVVALWQQSQWTVGLNWATGYLAFSAAYGALHVPLWVRERLLARGDLPQVRLREERVIDLCGRLGEPPTSNRWTRLLCALPFNQLWQLQVSHVELHLPALPPSLDGLSICHLSDLHFSDRIDRPYFDEVARLTNELQVDLVALTGDLCDHARCIDWIPEVLGPIDARLGKYFILGNHDLRTRDVARLRGTMRVAGFTDVGGRHEPLAAAGIVMTGNERPWFRHVLPPLGDVASEAFKILLAHTPDQLRWARNAGFDLMLAGHTHGGQIRFPIVGAVVCPSWHGTKYACGFFYEEPTLLHVSRGTASYFPYRMNCRAEITKLVLRRTT